MGNMDLIFGLIMTGCGIYCLYTWGKIRATGKVPDGAMILPVGHSEDDCLDLEEYLSFIMPKFLIVSILVVLFGGIMLANAYLSVLDTWTAGMAPGLRLLVLELITCFIPLGVVIWFAVCLRRAQKRFF